MIIDCISDLHGNQPELEGGDLLIVAGDITAMDTLIEWGLFFAWLKKQKYKKKILIGGNHDNFLESAFPKNKKEAEDLKEVIDSLDSGADFEYLCDSGTEFSYFIDVYPEEDEGFLPSGHRTLKIWGSPWTRAFHGMNPKCKAFIIDKEERLFDKFELIPHDTDILITHYPPYGILDGIPQEDGSLFHVGSHALYNCSEYIENLKLHIFGHIHEGYGIEERFLSNTMVKSINASIVNEYYKPVNKPIRIEL